MIILYRVHTPKTVLSETYFLAPDTESLLAFRKYLTEVTPNTVVIETIEQLKKHCGRPNINIVIADTKYFDSLTHSKKVQIQLMYILAQHRHFHNNYYLIVPAEYPTDKRLASMCDDIRNVNPNGTQYHNSTKP